MFVAKVVVFTLVLVAGLCSDLNVGVSVNNELVYSEKVQLSSVPLKVRTKNVFYSDTRNKTIKGLQVIDLDFSEAKATVTAGGVGSTFVNIKMKSERGAGLNYQVYVFA